MTVRGRTRGVVAAGDSQTALAGARLLEVGGNAVDAIVAAAFAAFVCELPLCSPLGGAVMLLEEPSGETHAIDMFARAPGLGSERPSEMDFRGLDVRFGATSQTFHVGRASAAVPLALPGLLDIHARWGRIPLAEVVAPAIAYGRGGFTLGPVIASILGVLAPILAGDPECRALYATPDAALGAGQGGTGISAGALLRNTELAGVLEDLARSPTTLRDVYAAFAREFGTARGGLVTQEDVDRARITSLSPIRLTHRGWNVATMPAPSTGGMLVALGLRLHEGDGKHAFLSREHLLGVARVQEILLEERGRASLDDTYVEALRARLAARKAASPVPDSVLGSTTHLSAIDENGLTVALTLTNGEGCGHVLAGTGMLVNNLLGEEDIHPNGFHLDPPGQPLTTMMAPTILRSGGRRVALGSGGSNRLRNAILQVLLGLVEHEKDIATAVEAPRVQIEARTDRTFRLAFEGGGLAPDVTSALLATYPVDPAVFDGPTFFFGGVHAATASGDTFAGAGDPRRSGAVATV
jgi:gamma-glutamyltranspeptidase/glutathione hydrolase